MTRIFCIGWIAGMLWCLTACHHVPEEVIPPGKMEDLLVDIHTSEGLMEIEYTLFNTPEKKEAARKAILQKHKVTEEQFDTSLVWYGKHLDDYIKIYDRVIERLKAQDDALRAEIEAGEMQTLTRPGDTVNIWKQENYFTLQPGLLQGILTFNIAVDENFQIQDEFVLRLNVMAFPRYEAAPLQVLLGVEHTNDSIRYVTGEISKNGWAEFTLSSDSIIPIRQVFGNIVLTSAGDRKKQEIYLDPVQLIRIHQKKK